MSHLCSGLREKARSGPGYKACVICVRVYHAHGLYLFCMCFLCALCSVCVICVFYVSNMHMYKYPLVGRFGLIKTVAGKERRRNQHPHVMLSINIWDLARNFSNNNKMGGRRHSLSVLSWYTEWMWLVPITECGKKIQLESQVSHPKSDPILVSYVSLLPETGHLPPPHLLHQTTSCRYVFPVAAKIFWIHDYQWGSVF